MINDDFLGYGELDPIKAMDDSKSGKERVILTSRPGKNDEKVKGTCYINYSMDEKENVVINDWYKKVCYFKI